MSQRRMFSLKIVDTDNFLAMPVSARLLYYDLSLRADDDGFVDSPKKILKIIGCSEDDFKVLCAKQYLIPFETGVCVIKHWHIHNLIRADRYTETECQNEKACLEKINNKYELTCGMQNVIPNGNHLAAQVRLGKDRLGKDRLEKSLAADAAPKKIIDENKLSRKLKEPIYTPEFLEAWDVFPHRKANYGGVDSKPAAYRNWLSWVANDVSVQNLLSAARNWAQVVENTDKEPEYLYKMSNFYGRKDNDPPFKKYIFINPLEKNNEQQNFGKNRRPSAREHHAAVVNFMRNIPVVED